MTNEEFTDIQDELEIKKILQAFSNWLWVNGLDSEVDDEKNTIKLRSYRDKKLGRIAINKRNGDTPIAEVVFSLKATDPYITVPVKLDDGSYERMSIFLWELIQVWL